MGLKLLFKKNFIFILLLLIFLLGCKKNEEKVVHKKIKNKKLLEEVVPWRGYENCLSLYKDKLFFLKEDTNRKSYTILIFNENYEIIRRLKFSRGKGPGEFMYPFDLELYKNKIYIYDDLLKRISVFNLKGNHVEDYNVNFANSTSSFEINNNYFIFSGAYLNNLIKYDFKNKKIVKKVKFEKPLYKKTDKKVEFEGKEVLGAYFEIDREKKRLVVGRHSKPVTIEIYDYNLNQIEKINYKLPEDYEKVKYHEHMIQYGDYVIGGICFNKENLYVSFGANASKEKISRDFYILVFDRNSYEYKYTIKNRKLNNIISFVTIGGILNEKLNFIIWERDKKRSSFLGYKKDNKYITVLLNLEI